MIPKILPAHFIIELTGAATTTSIPESFHVESIIFASTEFESDLQALAAGEVILRHLLPKKHRSKLEVNPEFFPSAGEELDDEEEAEELELLPTEELPTNLNQPLAPRLMRVDLTKNFDSLGDFVQLRKIYSSKGSKATLRVLSNPSAYMQEKVRQLEEQYSPDKIHRELSSTQLIQ
jgi:hypothetical protein